MKMPRFSMTPIVEGVLYKLMGPPNPWVTTQGFYLPSQGVVIDPMTGPPPTTTTQEDAMTVSHLFLSHNHIVGASDWAKWEAAYPGLTVISEVSEGPFDYTFPKHEWQPFSGKSSISVAKIPGHRPGHLAFRYHDGRHHFLFGGDTLDPASERFCEDDVAGQVDSLLWLRHSLADDPPTVVAPTHGTVTTDDGSNPAWYVNEMNSRIRGFSKHFWHSKL